jgi:hypothetical protein
MSRLLIAISIAVTIALPVCVPAMAQQQEIMIQRGYELYHLTVQGKSVGQQQDGPLPFLYLPPDSCIRGPFVFRDPNNNGREVLTLPPDTDFPTGCWTEKQQ